MRTAPLALAYLHDPDGLVEAARAVSALTHYDPEAGEACVLWCLAIRHAVLHGTLDGLGLALDRLPADRATVWAHRIAEAEAHPPWHFTNNGWVVQALQGAWSAITRTPIPDDNPADGRLRRPAPAARPGGRGPRRERHRHGRRDRRRAARRPLGGLRGPARRGRAGCTAGPGYAARDLIRLGLLTARHGHPDRQGWPGGSVFDYSEYGGAGVLARHPHDDRVWLGGVQALRDLPDGVDAVVSLCRLGADEVPAPGVDPGDHVEVWLIDSPDPDRNPHLDHVLTQAADTVAALRAEGRTVLLHCVPPSPAPPRWPPCTRPGTGASRPTTALAEVTAALPDAHPNRAFRAALDRLTPTGGGAR